MESWLITLSIVVILTTIAVFSGFSGYLKGWLLQIMESWLVTLTIVVILTTIAVFSGFSLKGWLL